MKFKTKTLKQIILSGLLLVSLFINSVFLFNGLDSLHDFGSFFASGQLASNRQNPYSIESPLIFLVQFPKINLEGFAPNLNPPISVLLFEQMASLEPFQAINIWRIISLILFFVAIIVLQRAYPVFGFDGFLRIIWSCNLAGVWHAIQLGQLYTAMLLLSVLVYYFLERRRMILAGIFLGILISIKPNFIIWAILLLAGSQLAVFVTAAICFIVISMIPVFVYGINIYTQWLEASALYTPALLLFPGNNSFQGLTSRFGFPSLGILFGVVLLILLMWYLLKKRPELPMINVLGILASLLVSPIAWTGYMLVLLPHFFLTNPWNRYLKTSALIFSIPVIFPLVFFESYDVNFVLFGWFYGWGLLTLLGSLFAGSSTCVDKTDDNTNSIQTN